MDELFPDYKVIIVFVVIVVVCLLVIFIILLLLLRFGSNTPLTLSDQRKDWIPSNLR